VAIAGKFRATSSATSRRSAARRKLHLELQATAGGGSAAVTLRNLSSTGALLGTDEPLHVGERLRLVFPGGQLVGAKVVWAGDALFGCKFDNSIGPALLSAARLKSVIDEPDESSIPEVSPTAALPETFGGRVRRLRLARGISQIGMARLLGVSKPAVWKWERDQVRPRPDTLASLADALKVTPSELVFGTEGKAASGRGRPGSLQAIIDTAKAQVAETFGLPGDAVTVTITIRD
jgi:transcriptional regulator with XRE-family HTH domain